MTILRIDMLGGMCPVQAEGIVYNMPFYFRARGQSWSMSVAGMGGDIWDNPAWYYEEPYGKNPFDAGYMSEGEALKCIATAVDKYIDYYHDEIASIHEG